MKILTSSSQLPVYIIEVSLPSLSLSVLSFYHKSPLALSSSPVLLSANFGYSRIATAGSYPCLTWQILMPDALSDAETLKDLSPPRTLSITLHFANHRTLYVGFSFNLSPYLYQLRDFLFFFFLF